VDRDGLTIVPEARPTILLERPAPGGAPPATTRSDVAAGVGDGARDGSASSDNAAGADGRASDRAERRGTFRALASRPFRYYFIGQLASASGTFLQQTAIGWLALELTKSAAALGLVLAVGGVPSLVLGPWGGAIADRVDLRRLPTCRAP